MSKRLVEIALAVIHGLGEESSASSVAEQLVTKVLRPINPGELRVCGALLLATSDWCEFPSSISKVIRGILKEKLTYDVPLFGASMAGFYCSTEPEPFIKHGLLLLTICSNDLWITVGHLREPHSQNQRDRNLELTKLAQDLDERAGTKLGGSADKTLFGFLPGIVTNPRGERAYFDNDLHQEILKAFDHRYQLIGAASADAIDPQVGYQFADDLCLRSGLVLALIESELSTAAMMTHGFKPFDNVRISVDALADGKECGYRVTKLDGRPAAVRLNEIRTEGMTKLENPVFGLPCGPDFNIIWPHKGSIEEDSSIRLARKVSIGDRLYVLKGAPTDMLRAGSEALKGLLDRTGAAIGDIALILGFSCVGRVRNYAAQKTDWRDAINRLREDYLGVPLVWALSAGEFGIDQWQRMRANNMTISVTCLTNNYSRRAQVRKLQRHLLNAASRLTMTDSPKRVMEVALRGAIQAGSTGGQVCIVDNRMHRIIGKGFGYATKAPHSTHDWDAIAEVTDRPAPRRTGGHFPLYLKEWALPVTPDIAVRLDFAPPALSSEEKEDLLTLIVRTQHAIHVRDSKDPRFHCNQKTVALGNLGRQIAMPLLGSQGTAIATLQVGFPDDQSIDREGFSLWTAYSQKVATALERASEVKERGALGKITKLGGSIMQTPINPKGTPTSWCQDFVAAVVDLLEADGGHMRVARPGGEGDEHFLAAVVGHLADILPLTRPVIREGDGSYDKKMLNSKGHVSNLKEETQTFLNTVKAVAKVEEYGPALERELNKIEALARLPIYDQQNVIGSLDVYSKRQYFFTERRERIARTSALLAGDILRAKTAEYDRFDTDAEKEWILESLTVATEGIAEVRLHSLLRRLCEKVRANTGSVFVWYEDAQKLILRESCGWHRPMNGQASYDREEGWTGRTAFSTEDVVIVSPSSTDEDRGTKKYYKSMIPPEHRVPTGTSDARIGLRLTAGKDLVGFVMLSYYRESSKYLVHNDQNIINFLKAVRGLITLAVEAVNQEAKQEQMQKLVEARGEVAKLLINSSGLDRAWQSVMEIMREGFSVERVTFYHVRPDKHFQLGWSSQLHSRMKTIGPKEPREPIAPLTDVILRQKAVSIQDASDVHLDLWPNRRDIKSVFAIPVVGTRGEVGGVLEFVNRITTVEHPFEFFDLMEKAMAWNIATPVAAALERRQYDKALSELTSKLTTATKIGASGLFGVIVMHQVMAPFTKMRGAVDWLKLHPNSPVEERDGQLNRIEAAYSQAVETIKQAAYRGVPGPQRIGLRNLIQQTLRVMEPELPIAGVRKHVDNNLNVVVNVDLWSMVGALVNLISNALDAMSGDGDLRISTSLSTDGQNAVIRIHNTGRRLTVSQIKRILQPGVSTKSSEEHLGLGLPLAKQAVENAGGNLEMYSPETGGVEAVVTLPISQAPVSGR